jgi:uncharacterized membrane protein (DUF106 family)
MVDIKKESRMQQEVTAYRRELMNAVKAKDKDKEERLKRKEQTINKMQMKITTGRLKVLAVTWVPFLLLYYFLASLIPGGLSGTVAYSPVPIPILVGTDGKVPLFWWYLISSLGFAGITSKLLGTTPSSPGASLTS